MTASDLRAFFDVLGAGDLDDLYDRLAEDVTLTFPGRRFGGRIEGRRRVLVFLRQNRRLFRGGMRFTVHWAAVAGDRGVVQWTNAGTTREGRDYANRGVTVFRLEGERIAAIDDYLDTEAIAETWPR